MPINAIKRDIKRHRPIDWFAIVILISASIFTISMLMDSVEQFSKDMDREAQKAGMEMMR